MLERVIAEPALLLLWLGIAACFLGAVIVAVTWWLAIPGWRFPPLRGWVRP